MKIPWISLSRCTKGLSLSH